MADENERSAATQADRDRAADWLHDEVGSVTWEQAGRIRRGEETHGLVDVLARHRLASTPSPIASGPVGEVERRWKAALQDIADAEAIPNDAEAFLFCRDIARAALQPELSHE